MIHGLSRRRSELANHAPRSPQCLGNGRPPRLDKGGLLLVGLVLAAACRRPATTPPPAQNAPAGRVAAASAGAEAGAATSPAATTPTATTPTATTPTASPAPDTGVPAGWPRVLVVGPGTGPALYLGNAAEAPAVGYLNPGVRIRLEGAPVADRIEVRVGGALQAKGWVPVDRLAAYAQRRGRLPGTRAYFGPNDWVGILGPAEDGQLRVRVRPWLGGQTYLEAMSGKLPADAVSDRPVDAATAQGPTPGQCYQLPPGQAVPVYEHPQREPIASLPVQTPPASVVVLRERNEWRGIRAGYGPYLTGYVRVPLAPCLGSRPPPAPAVPRAEGERPYWMSQEPGALHRVANGTRVKFADQVIARLRQQGWARELGRPTPGWVDVFVAVDDSVALRGLVPEGALTLLEGTPTPAPTPPAAPAPAATTPAATKTTPATPAEAERAFP